MPSLIMVATAPWNAPDGSVQPPGTVVNRVAWDGVASYSAPAGMALQTDTGQQIWRPAVVLPPSTSETPGGMRAITAAGPATIASSDGTVIVNQASGAAITLNLPAAPVAEEWHRIKDGKGDAGTNNITVSGNGKLIDGAASYVIGVNSRSIDLYFNGTGWNIV